MLLGRVWAVVLLLHTLLANVSQGFVGEKGDAGIAKSNFFPFITLQVNTWRASKPK